MKMKNNHMNWRSLKIALIVSTVFVTMLVGISWIVSATAPTDSSGNVTGDSVFHPALHLIDVGSMLFVGGGAIIVAYVLVRLFFRHTVGRWAGSDDMDSGWKCLTAQEKTRWVLGAIIAITCALISTAGASEKGGGLPVSKEAAAMIAHYEIGGRTYYERRLARPTVPAWRHTASGVTVGFGYDCGYHSKKQIAEDWKGIASPSEIKALQAVSGLKGRRAYYASRRMRHSVYISYPDALKVFREVTIPRYAARTARAFNLAKGRLHGHSNGALVSLVFNRGGSMKGKRRMEMRWIRHNLATKHDERVPGDIRHMKRLWSYRKLKGLHLRRDAEARMFERGIGRSFSQ